MRVWGWLSAVLSSVLLSGLGARGDVVFRGVGVASGDWKVGDVAGDVA